MEMCYFHIPDGKGKSRHVKRYDTVRSIASDFMGGSFIPKSLVSILPTKSIVFDPFIDEPLTPLSGVARINSFIPTTYMKIRKDSNTEMPSVNWDSIPTCKMLFDNVFPNPKERDFFINWLAYGVQNRRKTRTSIVSRGIQGTGKGVIFSQIIQKIYGHTLTDTLSQVDLEGRFNGKLSNKMFILANEVKADYREGNSTYEKLKMYVSDDSLQIEKKGVDMVEEKNYFNMWFHSNDAVPIQIEGKDRRYSVMDTSDKNIGTLAKEKGIGNASTFVNLIKEEAHALCVQLMLIKTDERDATTPLDSKAKKSVVEMSIGRTEVLCNALKDRDYEYLSRVCHDIFEDAENNGDTPVNIAVSITVKVKRIPLTFDTPEELLEEVKSQLNTNRIEAHMLACLYESISPNKSAHVRGRDLSKYLNHTKKSNNIRFRDI